MLGRPRRLGFWREVVLRVLGFLAGRASGDDAIAIVSSLKFASAAVWSMTDGPLPSLKTTSDEEDDMMLPAATVPSTTSVFTIRAPANTAFALAIHSVNVE